jgi:hypothetical protein
VLGVERSDRELLDARAVVGHLVAEGSMFWFLAEHRHEVFKDSDFDDLFPSGRGRPSIPAPVMASVLVLQTLHDLSDRETAEAVRCDLRWKVATGLALDHEGFDASTLVYWRRRLAKSLRPHRINDAVRVVVAATGVVRGRSRRAVDSTILDDAVATQDTITQLVSVIRRVGRQVPGAAEQIQAVCTGHDYSKPGKPVIDWDDPAARDALVSVLVNDANALVDALSGQKLDEAAEQVVALLALVAGQDVEPAEGSDGTDGRWRIARKVAPDRVISTVDPEARHTRKSPRNTRDGYRAHVATEPETGIITDEALTQAAGPDNSDAATAQIFLGNETGNETGDQDGDQDGALEWYGDSAYATGDLRGVIEDAGHTAVIKPSPVKAAIEGGFTIDDFTVDEDAQTVTCPAGQTRPITKTRAVAFGVLCRDCPLRTRCTTAKNGRILHLHDRDALLREARRDWSGNPDLRQNYRAFRPNVERVVSQIASQGGRRVKLRYRGTAKNHAWLKRRTAALNLRNLISRGLTRIDGHWTLATA